jgi:bifunctional DNase/RNase
MIHVKVAGLSLSNVGFVVVLRGEHDPRALPIFIGGAEAQSIAVCMEKVDLPRPLTHDLFKNVLDCLECRLKRVVIHDLEDNTFYALLILEHDGVETEMDARPSDALALALRSGAPIFVTRKVMDAAGLVLDEKTGDGPAEASDEAKPGAPVRVSGLDKLKGELDEAIRQERYEDAARLRDEIRKLEQSHAKN